MLESLASSAASAGQTNGQSFSRWFAYRRRRVRTGSIVVDLTEVRGVQRSVANDIEKALSEPDVRLLSQTGDRPEAEVIDLTIMGHSLGVEAFPRDT